MPLNDNGIFTPLDDNQALAATLDIAAAVGLDVAAGSVEDIIVNALARQSRIEDNRLGDIIARFYQPAGSDIDLQNKGIPRLDAAPATGFLRLVNNTGADINVALNTVVTAPNGNTYSTFNNFTTVPANSSKNIGVQSEENGIAQNLPSGQTFTGMPAGLTATNPQPFTDGRDLETDAQYVSRITYLRTNFTSQNTTAAAERELQSFYTDARVYINNEQNAVSAPIPKPPNGYTAVIRTVSGVDADFAELQNAFSILANRFQFTNAFAVNNSLHPVKQGTIYTANIPQQFFLLCAQQVGCTLTATLTVNFADFTDNDEKKAQAFAFAKFFAQNIINYLGGAAGNFSCTFTPADYYEPTTEAIAVEASEGFIAKIGPTFSIEQIRALISEAANLPSLTFLNYLSCDTLQVVLTPGDEYESGYTLDIAGPLTYIDFKKTALFTDGTAWFDRFVYLDPADIVIEIVEA